MARRVGIVGMGLMGQAFIKNMRETGFEVQGFDVNAARMDELREWEASRSRRRPPPPAA